MKTIAAYLISFIFAQTILNAQGNDTLAIHWVGHGSVYLEFNGITIHVDPNSEQADYSSLPVADLICITHSHGDHYDLNAISAIKTDSTLMLFTQELKDKATYNDTSVVLNNWDSLDFKSVKIKAVPAYNIPPGQIFHPEGVGNGYIFTFNNRKVYIAGDTEDIPEMAALGKIDIAFLPMNLPYSMTPEQAAEAALAVAPNMLYIYHFGNSDTTKLTSLLNHTNIDIRTGQHLQFVNTLGEWPSIEINETGINDWIRNNYGILFPNPVKNEIYINIINPNTKVSLYSSDGQLLYQNLINTTGQHAVDVSFLKSGIYICRITNKESDNTQRFIKK